MTVSSSGNSTIIQLNSQFIQQHSWFLQESTGVGSDTGYAFTTHKGANHETHNQQHWNARRGTGSCTGIFSDGQRRIIATRLHPNKLTQHSRPGQLFHNLQVLKSSRQIFLFGVLTLQLDLEPQVVERIGIA